MPAPSGPLPGFRDFYPEEFAERAQLMTVWRDVARRYGFVEYDGPPLEPLDLFTRKSGDEIVGQLYNFVDKGGREVALRPEMTPTFARMVSVRAATLRKPVRWFSIPQLFRYERQQRGRLREHFQLNVDIVGEADVTADAELVAVATDIMRGLGLDVSDVRVRASDRRLLTALLESVGISFAAHPAVFAVLDKLERQPREASEHSLRNAGLDAGAIAKVLELVRARDTAELRARVGTGDRGVTEAIDRFDRYLACLDALGAREWVTLDLTIVRGLAYYTGIVFELFDARGELRAICGGGRYDELLGDLGGDPLPALGFGMGDVVLGELLRARGKLASGQPSIDAWIAADGDDAALDAMRLARRLRDRGWSVEYALRPQTIDKQIRAARAAGARQLVLLDGHGGARLRTLADGSEVRVDLASWPASE